MGIYGVSREIINTEPLCNISGIALVTKIPTGLNFPLLLINIIFSSLKFNLSTQFEAYFFLM